MAIAASLLSTVRHPYRGQQEISGGPGDTFMFPNIFSIRFSIGLQLVVFTSTLAHFFESITIRLPICAFVYIKSDTAMDCE